MSFLIDLLAQRHTKDLFIPECKDGPTWHGGHLRMDAWAMRRSWANPCMTGYECKLSRGDFLADKKWPAYLPMCNEFYFVCLPGLIKPEELPAEVGLMYGHAQAKRVTIKRKAVWREAKIPETLWQYILMCRVRMVPPHYHEHDSAEHRREYWKTWLKTKEEDRELGYMVSRSIRDLVEKRIHKIDCENKWLKSENEILASAKKCLEAIGVNVSDWQLDERIKKALDRPQVSPDFVSRLRDMERMFGRMVKECDTRAGA